MGVPGLSVSILKGQLTLRWGTGQEVLGCSAKGAPLAGQLKLNWVQARVHHVLSEEGLLARPLGLSLVQAGVFWGALHRGTLWGS